MFDFGDPIAEALWTSIVDAEIAEGRIGLVTQDVCQPVIGGRDQDHVLYSECLVRLIGGDGAVRRAGEFVPYLEMHGAAKLLDRIVLDLTLTWLAGDPQRVLGCNLSAQNLDCDEDWVEISRRIDARSDLASRLVLEVTENRPLIDPTAARRRLNSVRALGCRVAIDDFGAGFATPARLDALDVDIVKIDRAYVAQHPDQEPVTRGLTDLEDLVRLAVAAAPFVVVEGVETSAQLHRAIRAGATHVQGRHLAPELEEPGPSHALAEAGVRLSPKAAAEALA